MDTTNDRRDTSAKRAGIAFVSVGEIGADEEVDHHPDSGKAE
ncbi:hypothetical protein [Mycetocola miduiensis]|nr:hypothetical protein [Mycetocola miduiensis]